MNQLDDSKRAQVLQALCEGNSIRSVTRMFGVGKNTVARLLIQAGAACARYQDKHLRNLKVKRIQCDEIWAFCYAKDKNVPSGKQGKFGFGSVWTWCAIDAESKLICSYMIGNRDAQAASAFIDDLAGRLSSRIQLTTDGHAPYLQAVEGAFGADVDYAMLIKLYGESAEAEKRYSPAECVGAQKKPITGTPDPKHISTSYVERQNLTMRMHMRRFTQLTNGFSKKLKNHIAALSLHFMYYNFVKIHGTVRVTPAMAASVTNKLWEMSDVVELVEQYRKDRQEEGRVASREAIERSYGKGPALGQ